MLRCQVGAYVCIMFVCSHAISQDGKMDALLLGKWEAEIMFAGAKVTIHLEFCKDGSMIGEMRDDKGLISSGKGKYKILDNSYLELSMVDDKNAKKKDKGKSKYKVTKESLDLTREEKRESLKPYTQKFTRVKTNAEK